MGVYFPDPSGTKAMVMMNQARATQNAVSKMAPLMPDVPGQEGGLGRSPARRRRWWRSGEGLSHPAAVPEEEYASTAEKAAESIWRDQGFQLCHMTHIHRTILLASLPMTLHGDMQKLLDPVQAALDQELRERGRPGADDRGMARHPHAHADHGRPARPADLPGLLRQPRGQLPSPSSARRARQVGAG
jgi:hypothetical protein